jgi:hypothetical protein
MVSHGRRDPPNGFALEALSICLAENLTSAGEGDPLTVIGHPEGTENHWRTLAHPLESLSLIPSYATAAADMPEATGSRISLEIRHDRIYEPYGLKPPGDPTPQQAL